MHIQVYICIYIYTYTHVIHTHACALLVPGPPDQLRLGADVDAVPLHGGPLRSIMYCVIRSICSITY